MLAARSSRLVACWIEGMGVFDEAARRGAEWIDELMTEMRWSSPGRAFLALRTVLHAMRDTLPVPRASDFGDHLPLVIRGVYFEGWQPDERWEDSACFCLVDPSLARSADARGERPVVSREVALGRTRREFLARVGGGFDEVHDFDAERLVLAVVRVLARHAPEADVAPFLQLLEPSSAGGRGAA